MPKLMPGATDDEFLNHCYRHLLSREPDPGGKNHHLAALSAGMPRETLLQIFVQSDEFLDRFNAAQDLAKPPPEFAPAGHFYSPIPLPKDFAASYESLVMDEADREFVNEDRQLELAEKFRVYYKRLPFPAEASEQRRYYLNNGSFNYFDGIILYCFIRYLRPQQIIEVGSGFSSALMVDTCEEFLSGNTKLTFIDPFPETLNRCLRPADHHTCRILPMNLQEVPLETFRTLTRNDILFIDSSHVSKFGSDVNHLLFKVLPLLPSGVVIHFHDIFRNFDYPQAWLQEGRSWNEAYVVRAFLAGNADYKIRFFNDWFADRHWDFLQEHMPLCTIQPERSPFKNCGVSLWIEKV